MVTSTTELMVNGKKLNEYRPSLLNTIDQSGMQYRTNTDVSSLDL